MDARRALEQAAQLSPSVPAIHGELANIWANLGFDANAQREAKAALDLSGALPREARLRIEGEYLATTREFSRAVEVYRSLWNMAPDNLNRGLRLADVELLAGKPEDAKKTIESLRRLPVPAGDDPRIDIEASHVADEVGESAAALSLLDSAARKADTIGARFLQQQIELGRATNLNKMGRYAEALVAVRKADRIAAALGHVPAQAFASQIFGAVLLNEGKWSDAKEAFSEALTLSRKSGNVIREVDVLNDLANIEAMTGNPKDALAAYRRSYAAARRAGTAAALKTTILLNIADTLHGLGEITESEWTIDRLTELARASGNRLSLGIAALELAELRLEQGRAVPAAQLYAEGLETLQSLGRTTEAGMALMGFSEVLAWQGNLNEARGKLSHAAEIWKQSHDEGKLMLTQVIAAELDLKDGRKPDQAPLEQAQVFFETQKRREDAFSTAIVLLRVLSMDRKTEGVNRQIEVVRALGSKGQRLSDRLDANIAVAEALAQQGRTREARTTLDTAVALAKARKHRLRELQAQVSFGKLLAANGRGEAGKSILSQVGKQSAALGLNYLARSAAVEAELPRH